jgi:hypothetical protein
MLYKKLEEPTLFNQIEMQGTSLHTMFKEVELETQTGGFFNSHEKLKKEKMKQQQD